MSDNGSTEPRSRNDSAIRYLWTNTLTMLKELEHLHVQIARLNAIKLNASDTTQRQLSMVIDDLMALGEGTRLKLGLDVAGSELDASTTKMCEWRVATALSTGNGAASIATTADGLRNLANKGLFANRLTS